MPLISIITACYNHGIYLDEAYASIQMEKYADVFEHIIVNDGSTDAFTLEKLKELEQRNVKVIHQPNSGLAKARNAGIALAKGKYILPLDCDNKLVPEVFIEAAQLMENDTTVDVVHTQAFFFGSREGVWAMGQFNMERMFAENHIDACALIRKTAFDEVGGYSEDMPVMGHEDWELWIKIGIQGRRFHYLEKPGFYYRVHEQSMAHTVSNPNLHLSLNYIFKKHCTTAAALYQDLYYQNIDARKTWDAKTMYVHKNRIKSVVKLILGKKVIW